MIFKFLVHCESATPRVMIIYPCYAFASTRRQFSWKFELTNIIVLSKLDLVIKEPLRNEQTLRNQKDINLDVAWSSAKSLNAVFSPPSLDCPRAWNDGCSGLQNEKERKKLKHKRRLSTKYWYS